VTTYTWNNWAKQSAASSGGPTLAPGHYTGEIIDAGAKPIKDGRPRFWWKFKILVGPYAGETEVMSQLFSPENEKARNVFFWQLSLLGIDFNNVADGATPESIAKLAIGRRFEFDFDHRESGGKVYPDFKNVVQLGDAPVAQAPVVAVPAAAAPAIDAVAAAPVAAVAASPTVEELQAQLAALQAPAPAAEAPAAPAAPAGGALPF